MLDYTSTRNNKTSSGFGKMSLFFFVIGTAAWLTKKYKLQLTGRHKKNEFEFRSFPTGSGTIKYRDS